MKSKTKILLGFLVGGIILVGGWWIHDRQASPEMDERILATTDKTAYEQGETISITIENNLKESIFSRVNRTPVSCFCIDTVERKTSDWGKLSPAGSNLELSASIVKAKHGVQDLIKMLDELYETIQSGDGEGIEAKTKEYLNISGLIIKDMEIAFSRFQDTTDIQLSLGEYNEIRSNFNDAMIDLTTDNFMLSSCLFDYFEDPKSPSTLDKIKRQINKTKKSAYSVKDFCSSLVDPQEIKSGQSKTFEWKTLIKGTSLPVQAPPGRYRLSILYENYKKTEWKSVYTNEFTIK